jgi:hypothetical protein
LPAAAPGLGGNSHEMDLHARAGRSTPILARKSEMALG